MNMASRAKKSKEWKIGLYDSSIESETAENNFAVKLEGKMPAYLIVELDVVDADKFDAYRQMVPPTIAAYGGRYIVRGGKTETLEGNWSPKRVVILEFPSMEKAKAWLDSPEYAEPKALRHSCARSQMLLVEGL